MVKSVPHATAVHPDRPLISVGVVRSSALQKRSAIAQRHKRHQAGRLCMHPQRHTRGTAAEQEGRTLRVLLALDRARAALTLQ